MMLQSLFIGGLLLPWRSCWTGQPRTMDWATWGPRCRGPTSPPFVPRSQYVQDAIRINKEYEKNHGSNKQPE